MAARCTNIFHSKALQNKPKLGFWYMKKCHLAILVLMPEFSSSPFKLSFPAARPGLPDFFVATFQNGEKYTKRPQNVPSDRKLFQMTYSKCKKLYQTAPLQGLPKRY
jgi:hypothetical protein